MGPITGVAIYLTLWWTVLFGVLPLGNRTYAEEGREITDGGDPGAPVNPNLKKKFLITTVVSAVLWLILFVTIKFGLITLPQLPSYY